MQDSAWEVRDILHQATCKRRYGNGVGEGRWLFIVSTVGNQVYSTQTTVHLNPSVP